MSLQAERLPEDRSACPPLEGPMAEGKAGGAQDDFQQVDYLMN